MRIAILCEYAYPELSSTAVLYQQLGEDLARHEHEIDYITCFPSYPYGRVYRGYRRKPWAREWVNGVHLLRLWSTFSRRRKNILSRLAEQITFTVGATLAACVLRADLVMAVSPPLFLGVPAWLLARRWRAPLILNIMDIYPDTVVNLGYIRPGLLVSLMARLEQWTYAHSDRIVVLSEEFRQNLLKKGVDPDKIKILPPWVDTDEIRPIDRENSFRRRHGLDGNFVAMFAGNIGYTSGLHCALQLAAALRDWKEFRLLIVGEGVMREDLQREVTERQLSNVSFLAFQPREILPEMLAAASVHLVTLAPGASLTSVPSKVYHAMAAGRPVLAVSSRQSALAAVVRDARCGLVVEPEDAAGMVAALQGLRADPQRAESMGQSGRRYVERHASREKISRTYEQMLLELMRERRPPGAQAFVGTAGR